MTTTGLRSLEVRSLIRPNGELEVSVIESSVPAPGSDEVIVRVEASPVNPSDQGLMYGPADLTSSRRAEVDGKSALVADIPAARLIALRARVGIPLRAGNEGAGTVIAAGQAPAAQALLGKRVAVFAPGMYAQYRCVGADRCVVLPSSITTEQGAACFINPLTALGIVETVRLEGHRALVHTAAASNLGLMLARICAEDGIPLVGIVRGPQQAARLANVGNARVLDTSAADFRPRLVDAIADCGATIAFDAIGGGSQGGEILAAMEQALQRSHSEYQHYGSPVVKQLYIYGSLDPSPTTIHRTFGLSFAIGGWLLWPFLQRIGTQRTRELQDRVVAGLDSTFRSDYTGHLSLQDLLDPDRMAKFMQRTTGGKFLLLPQRGHSD